MSDPFELGGGVADESQQLARDVLGRTALCLKLATMHHLDNAAMNAPIAEMLAMVNRELQLRDALRLQIIGDNLFLNHEIIKLDQNSFDSAQGLRSLFERLKIDELAFTAELGAPELRAFLSAFQSCIRDRSAGLLVQRRFEGISVRVIDVGGADGLTAELDDRQNVLRTFAGLAVAVKETLEALARGRPPRYAQLRRSLQSLADACAGHESLLVGLTRHRALGDPVPFHLTAVAALVLLMVRHLGLPRAAQAEAGMAALLHDVGRAAVTEGLRGEALADALDEVPLRSVLWLSQKGLNRALLSYVAVASEHGRDLTADPSPSMLARLVAVPCAFDLLTAPTPDRPVILPDRALGIILDRGGTRFDPAVTRLFAAVVGLYPVGSTVRLSGGELAIVMEVPGDPSLFAKPRVRVVRDAGGPTDRIVDLAEGTLRILQAVDPEPEEINAPHFLLA